MRELDNVAVIGFSVMLLSLPLAVGWVRRNGIYGFRVPATLRSDYVWYVVNRRMGWELVIYGAAVWLLAEGLSAFADPERVGRQTLWGVVAGLIALAVRGWLMANRVEREQPTDRSPVTPR
jgi:hypothetical protein